MHFSDLIWFLLIFSYVIDFVNSGPAFSCDKFTPSDYDAAMSPSKNLTEVSFGYRILTLDAISIISNVSNEYVALSFKNYCLHL